MRRSPFVPLALLAAAACASAPAPAVPAEASAAGRAPDTAPPWVRGTTCYEVFVRSFAD